jgi:hypothetical protein
MIKPKKPYVTTTLYLMLHSRLKTTLIVSSSSHTHTYCPFYIPHIIIVTRIIQPYVLPLWLFKVNNKIQEQEKRESGVVLFFAISVCFSQKFLTLKV